MDNDSIYELSILLNSKDYYSFNSWYINKKKKFLYLFLIIFILLISIFEINNLIKFKTFGSLIVTVPVIILLLIYYLIIAPKLLKSKSDKILKEDKTLSIETNYILTDDFIEEKNIYSVFKLKWVDTHEIVETKNYFFILISSIKGIIVPKRFIDENKYKQKIYELLHNKTSKSKKK